MFNDNQQSNPPSTNDNVSSLQDFRTKANIFNDNFSQSLKEFQKRLVGWREAGIDKSEQLGWLHHWTEVTYLEFKLQKVPMPVLGIGDLGRDTYAYYREGRNEFGLTDEIIFDEEHLRTAPEYELVGTLLHELLHLEQNYHGKRGRNGSPHGRGNYHNVAFRKRALELGLIVDEKGFQTYASGETPFLKFLDKYQINPPEFTSDGGDYIPHIPEPIRKSKSKLKLYECACGVKVRVGRSSFNAMCLDCNTIFTLKD